MNFEPTLDEELDFDSQLHQLGAPALRRLDALRKIQLQHDEITLQYHREFFELQKKYHNLYQPLYSRRADVVNGLVEPSDEDCKLPEGERSYLHQNMDLMPWPVAPATVSPTRGVPGFWRQALLNHNFTSELIEEHDMPALEALVDIRCNYLDDMPGFELEFEFQPNDYFTNTVLTKRYELMLNKECAVRGFTVRQATGTNIDWKPDANLTIAKEELTQQNHRSNATRTVTRCFPANTFFIFFKSPAQVTAAIDEEMASEIAGIVEDDYLVGDTIREQVIPYALDWFTGDAIGPTENEDDDEDDDDASFDSQDDDYSSDDDDDENEVQPLE